MDDQRKEQTEEEPPADREKEAGQEDLKWRNDLAQWYAPTLVVRKHISTAKKDNRPDAIEEDYHPIDIRLVLRGVAPTTYGVNSRVGPLEAIPRSWPKLVLALSAAMSLVWVVILIMANVGSDAQSFHRERWYVIAGLYGSSTFLMILLASATSTLLSSPWWTLPALINVAAIALAVWACLLLHTPVVLIAVLVLALFLFVLLPAVQVFLFAKPNSKELLEYIGPRKRPSHRPGLVAAAEATSEKLTHLVTPSETPQYLRFIGAGPPADDRSHRRRYWQLIQECKPGAASRKGMARFIPRRNKTGRGSEENVITCYPRTAYAHVVAGTGENSGLIAIQYWFAYYYDHWANNHEMDWEQVTVFLCQKKSGNKRDEIEQPAPSQVEPVACGFSQHFSGTVVSWNELETNPRVRPGESAPSGPVVYVARGSHANYPRPGRYRPATTIAGLRFTGKDLGFLGRSPALYEDACLPRPRGHGRDTVELSVATREPSGTGAILDDNVLRVITLPKEPPTGGSWTHDRSHACEEDDMGACVGDFRWLNLRGIWGSPGRIFGGDDAPKSPPLKDEWADPFFWLAECEEYERSFGRELLDRALAGEASKAAEAFVQPLATDGNQT